MVGTMLAGAAAGLASSGVQQLFTDYNREQDFGNYQKAVQQNFVNAQDMQRNAPMLTKLGMQAAGLNPAQMNNPTPASTAPASLGSHVSPDVNLATDNNLMADARLKNAEAEKTELQNDITRGENEGSFENYIKQADSLAQLYRERGWDKMAENIEDDVDNLKDLQAQGKLQFNVGNLRGAVNAFTTVQAMQERLSSSLDQMVKTETNYRMLIGDQSINLAKMPEVQKKLLMSQVSTNLAQAALMLSQKDLTKEQINELVKLQEKLESDIERARAENQLTEAQANSIRNADWKSLLKNKDFFGAFLAKADETEKQILNQIGTILGFTTGAKALKTVQGLGRIKSFLNGSIPNE